MHTDLSYADYCFDRGAFRQKELTVTQVYDRAYLEERYVAIDASVRLLAHKRFKVLSAFTAPGWLVDFGAGTGRFVEVVNGVAHWHALGFDCIPNKNFINADYLYRNVWPIVTFFDSLEHLVDPASLVQSLLPRTIMLSVPECHYPENAAWFMAWKHRRPGEHLWHWNRAGLDEWFSHLGYRPLLHSWFEDEFRENPAQREPNILTAIYRRYS